MNTEQDQRVPRHCHEINRCNQRGGRMLSVVDLLATGTLSTELAAYLLATISRGASFMVGARPGGAGKTTVMGALLNLVSARLPLRAADSLATIVQGLSAATPPSVYIGHELGPGDYYAYLWDEPLRAYFQLPSRGHLLATNLHADTLEEATEQVCGENQVSVEHFRRMNLILFLRVHGLWDARREIIEVWESDGSSHHALVYDRSGLHTAACRLANSAQIAGAHYRLEQVLASGAKTIEQVHAVLREAENHTEKSASRGDF